MRHGIAQAVACLMFCATCVRAADISGIWVGQQQGRRGEPEDLAFRFKVDGIFLTGKMFGDEFDLPIAETSLAGDQIRFTVTTTNYYSGTKVKFTYTGTIKGDEMELVRERVQTDEDRTANRPPARQILKLKRVK
jgi:hypothetical protein